MPRPPSLICKVVVAAAGNLLEWYDFAVFGILAPEIGAAFFPQNEAASEEEQQYEALVQSFTVYLGAFVVRPLGGMLFGYIGDKKGRETALLVTILLMAGPTFVIALLPTYAEIGLAAPVLLSLMRMLQGVAAGGELPGALVYAVESASPAHRGFFGAFVQASGVGSLLASAVVGALHLGLGEAEVAAWGWRLPFGLGGLIALLTCCVRRNFGATEEHAQARRDGRLRRNPLAAFCARGGPLPAVLVLACAQAMGMVGYYALFVWTPTYLRLSRDVPGALMLNSAVLLLWAGALLGWGALADRLPNGLLRVSLAGACAVMVLAPATFYALAYAPMCVAVPLLGLLVSLHAAYCGPLQAWMVLRLHDVGSRYSALGIGYNLSAALLAGTTPLIATFLSSTDAGAVGAGGYLSAIAAVSALTLHLNDGRGGGAARHTGGDGGGGVATAGGVSLAALDTARQQAEAVVETNKVMPEAVAPASEKFV